MTRDEASARIDELLAGSDPRSSRGAIEDARKLIGMLPERALAALRDERWIRTRPGDPESVEFFWSRSTFSIFDIGNRITTLRTLGSGNFSVDLGTPSPEELDGSSWQRGDDGEPMVGMLSLDREGADCLIGAIFDRQIAAG